MRTMLLWIVAAVFVSFAPAQAVESDSAEARIVASMAGATQADCNPQYECAYTPLGEAEQCFVQGTTIYTPSCSAVCYCSDGECVWGLTCG